MSDLDARLIELETIVAFHEETLTDLGSVLHEQRQTIDDLTRRLGEAEAKLREVRVGNPVDPGDEPPPPHY